MAAPLTELPADLQRAILESSGPDALRLCQTSRATHALCAAAHATWRAKLAREYGVRGAPGDPYTLYRTFVLAEQSRPLIDEVCKISGDDSALFVRAECLILPSEAFDAWGTDESVVFNYTSYFGLHDSATPEIGIPVVGAGILVLPLFARILFRGRYPWRPRVGGPIRDDDLDYLWTGQVMALDEPSILSVPEAIFVAAHRARAHFARVRRELARPLNVPFPPQLVDGLEEEQRDIERGLLGVLEHEQIRAGAFVLANARSVE